MGKKRFILFISWLLLFGGSAYSQVGVNTENPYKLTEFHVKNLEFTNAQGKNDTIPKGVMIPRLTEAQRDAIVIDDNDDANSLMIYNVDEDCYNYYSKTDLEWKSVCGQLGKAQFTFECSDVFVRGTYIEGQELTSSNYLSMRVNVSKPGSYTIIGETTNGYGFFLTGTFLSDGYHTIMVPGQGTPELVQQDVVKLTSNGIESTCNITVDVLTAAGTYSMSCGSATVSGIYKVGSTVNPMNHYISLPVTVTATGSWSVTSNVVDGLSFSGSGEFTTTGSQIVTLVAQGTPTSVTPKTITLSSNSAGSTPTSCDVTIKITIPVKKILTLGSAALYNVGSSSCGGNKLLQNQLAFGTQSNSVVASEGYTYVSNTSVTPDAAALLNLLNDKPDIVVTGYDLYLPATQAGYLADYVKKGGVLVFYCEGNGGGTVGTVANVMRALFNDNTITQARVNNRGALYELSNVNDEVLNGPFGDIRGRSIGEDASQSCAVYNIPENKVDVYTSSFSYSRPSEETANGLFAFKHKEYNFIYVGDGGNISWALNSTDTGAYPFGLDGNNMPRARTRFGEGAAITNGSATVFNSHLFANIMAWAIKQAEFYGINTQ